MRTPRAGSLHQSEEVPAPLLQREAASVQLSEPFRVGRGVDLVELDAAVSYTHLTLPTIYSV